MVRTFIAIDLTPEVRERMRGPQGVLAGCQARLTVVKPDSIHITLKFLGEIDEKTCDRVKEALSTIRFEPFEISLGGVKGNPSSSPRVVWSEVRDEGGCGTDDLAAAPVYPLAREQLLAGENVALRIGCPAITSLIVLTAHIARTLRRSPTR